MNKKINKLLSNLVVEYHKLQNFHWYIKGENFFEVHNKLEDLYNYINRAIDEVAEHALMIGVSPTATLKDFLSNATIKESDTKEKDSSKIFKEVLKDFQSLLDDVEDIKKQAEKDNDYLISNLMDDYISGLSKRIWMINQTTK